MPRDKGTPARGPKLAPSILSADFARLADAVAAAEAGATYVTVHIEATGDAGPLLDAIRKAGARPGLTLNPETDVARVLPHLDRAELVLVMSVHPGFGGQAFIPASLERVRALRNALDARGSTAELEVDGGIKPENAKDLARAGASVLVAGSAVYLDPDGVSAALAKFRKAVA